MGGRTENYGFANASDDKVCAVAYLRLQASYTKLTSHLSFKPQLEWQVAVTAARFMAQLVKEHTMKTKIAICGHTKLLQASEHGGIRSLSIELNIPTTIVVNIKEQ